MTQPCVWQKSSFSGAGDGGECVELAAVNGTVRLRESDAPADILTATPAGLASLIRGLRDERQGRD
ncbi:DUF397 domain-containing protein [Streptomyces sp. NBC_01387]|uniref:DUF397 domain-containing protein n=1 Tax=unclassified Streptomyces TaxID=2593676 RepID=UPI0020245D67|nr:MULTISPECIES: DUF397 domain-containing protein [unclassified Streptomyces]MCX4549715.1 DUF397 domain-containing protein [Streptomyces sp. NBC_01500]WSC21240.1 DUF397 domain-containing protein [Streptomyces sp. NBC_01766]WSV55176.1 DUF397 domain-containing protein [Streptomyces sp. NBC_01014]